MIKILENLIKFICNNIKFINIKFEKLYNNNTKNKNLKNNIGKQGKIAILIVNDKL